MERTELNLPLGGRTFGPVRGLPQQAHLLKGGGRFGGVTHGLQQPLQGVQRLLCEPVLGRRAFVQLLQLSW